MTIQEAKILKKETEIQIVKLLENFSTQTGLSVESIKCVSDETMIKGKTQIVILRLEVNL